MLFGRCRTDQRIRRAITAMRLPALWSRAPARLQAGLGVEQELALTRRLAGPPAARRTTVLAELIADLDLHRPVAAVVLRQVDARAAGADHRLGRNDQRLALRPARRTCADRPACSRCAGLGARCARAACVSRLASGLRRRRARPDLARPRGERRLHRRAGPRRRGERFGHRSLEPDGRSPLMRNSVSCRARPSSRCARRARWRTPPIGAATVCSGCGCPERSTRRPAASGGMPSSSEALARRASAGVAVAAATELLLRGQPPGSMTSGERRALAATTSPAHGRARSTKPAARAWTTTTSRSLNWVVAPTRHWRRPGVPPTVARDAEVLLHRVWSTPSEAAASAAASSA